MSPLTNAPAAGRDRDADEMPGRAIGRMTRTVGRGRTLAILVVGVCLLMAPRAFAATASPGWDLTLITAPTNLVAETKAGALHHYPQYTLIATNVGGAAAGGPGAPIVIAVTLPNGVTPAAASLPSGAQGPPNIPNAFGCSVAGQAVTCTEPNVVQSGGFLAVHVPVDVGSFADPSTVTARATVSGGGAASASTTASTTVSASLPSFGFLPGPAGLNASASERDGSVDTQAGSHPYQLTITAGLPMFAPPNGFPRASGTLRDLPVELPRGMVVNPNAASRCTEAQFEASECPDSSQIGLVMIPLASGEDLAFPLRPLFNIVPPPGVPAEFGFDVSNVPVHIAGGLHPGDYRLSSNSSDLLGILAVFDIQVQLWGSPSDASHDASRGVCLGTEGSSDACPVTGQSVPLLTMPSACSGPLTLEASADSWEEPGNFLSRSTESVDANGNPVGVSGCEQLDFKPTMTALPESTVADSPTGLHVDLRVPQDESMETLAEANLKDATVTLPAGMTLSPSAANGLQGCSEAQIGLGDGSEPSCPDASKIGSVEVDTPLLSDPLKGSVYLAQQGNLPGNGFNPFGSLLAIYVTAQAHGALIKLAGKVEADPATGRLTTRFLENPELPFSDFKLDFFGGPEAALSTPTVCGSYQTHYQLAPWSGTTPVVGDTPMMIDQGCSAAGFAPSFTAGTASNQAGSFSPFLVSLSRNDGEQRLMGLQMTLPPGASAKLAGVPLCSDTDANAGTCPDATRIGSVTVGSGAGPDPFFLKGTVYLTGPYNGGPYGEAVVVPAIAGPFNLGNVVVRGSIRVDPHTAQATVVSDPFPQFVGQTGVPTDVRRVDVTLDRPGFTFNPTNCQELKITGTLTSVNGTNAPVSQRFQAADCGHLAFKPKFTASASGKPSRVNGVSFDVKVTYPKAALGTYANVRSVKVTLPRQLPSRLSTLQKACPDHLFEENPANCPAASRVGMATTTTPVLSVPLTGPAYFVSHGSREFPDLVTVLQGNGVTVELTGETFISKKGITTSTFRSVPDVPFEAFDLKLPQGPFSALTNNGNLCNVKGGLLMPTAITGQNGAAIHQSTRIAVAGCPKHKAKKARKAGGRH